MSWPCPRRGALAVLAAAAAGRSLAQARPLRLLVPAPSGGTTDFVARALAAALQRGTGIPVVVDNRPGVGGTVATDALLSAPRGQPTFLLSPNSLVTELPHTIQPRYDPFKDLVALAEVARVGLVLVMDARLPMQTLAEVLAYVRARPGQVAYASFGEGTLSHIQALHLCHVAGLDMRHIGYKGSPAALVDVMGGRVPLMFDGITTSAPHVRSGALRGLAVTSPQRSPSLPQTPTFAELGFGALTQVAGITLFAGTSADGDLAQRVRRHVLEALQGPELPAALAAAGLEAAPAEQSVSELARTMRLEHDRAGRLLRSIRPTPAS